MTTTTVLALNTGSSSLKFACYGAGEKLLYQGAVTRIGLATGGFNVVDGQKNVLHAVDGSYPSIHAACDAMFDWIAHQGADFQFHVIGHRIVHGGPKYSASQLIDDQVLEDISHLATYAPEHIPPVLISIGYARQKYPDVPHVAAFDTAFHRSMPKVARMYPLPVKYEKHGLEKYGFHGLSYDYIMHVLDKENHEKTVNSKIIICHLGHGCSMAAVKNGHAADTTMGFSPTGGVPMSTRTGDLDPEVVLFLLQHEEVPIHDMKHLLNKEAGLLAISQFSDDMKDLYDHEDANPLCALAVEYFIYHAAKHIAALISTIEGVDTIVFTAGIGERSATTRERICKRLAYLGIEIDQTKNEANASTVTTDSSKVTVRVIPTNEELVIARQAAENSGFTL